MAGIQAMTRRILVCGGRDCNMNAAEMAMRSGVNNPFGLSLPTSPNIDWTHEIAMQKLRGMAASDESPAA